MKSKITAISTQVLSSNVIAGIGYGLVTVICWGILNVSTHNALQRDFLPADLTMLRYCVAGLICLPLVCINHQEYLRFSLWLKAGVFALLAGPLYGWLVNKGMQLSPLSHASAMVPTFTMVITMFILNAMNEKAKNVQILGVVIIIAGLYLLSTNSLAQANHSWLGITAFLLAAFIWSLFTILLRRWEVELVCTVMMMNIISGLIYLPVYLLQQHDHLSDITMFDWVAQTMIQSVFASIVVVFTFAKSVAYLGAAIASTLPALIPLVSILLAFMIFEQSITALEKSALATISIGFAICTLRKQHHDD